MMFLTAKNYLIFSQYENHFNFGFVHKISINFVLLNLMFLYIYIRPDISFNSLLIIFIRRILDI